MSTVLEPCPRRIKRVHNTRYNIICIIVSIKSCLRSFSRFSRPLAIIYACSFLETRAKTRIMILSYFFFFFPYRVDPISQNDSCAVHCARRYVFVVDTRRMYAHVHTCTCTSLLFPRSAETREEKKKYVQRIRTFHTHMSIRFVTVF